MADHSSSPLPLFIFPTTGYAAGFAIVLTPESHQVLIQRRIAEHPPQYKGTIWEFPGGGVHAEDPDLLYTALRELHEETDLPLECLQTQLKLLLFIPLIIPRHITDEHVGLFFFQWSQDPSDFLRNCHNTEEACDHRFINITDLDSMHTTEAQKHIFIPTIQHVSTLVP